MYEFLGQINWAQWHLTVAFPVDLTQSEDVLKGIFAAGAFQQVARQGKGIVEMLIPSEQQTELFTSLTVLGFEFDQASGWLPKSFVQAILMGQVYDLIISPWFMYQEDSGIPFSVATILLTTDFDFNDVVPLGVAAAADVALKTRFTTGLVVRHILKGKPETELEMYACFAFGLLYRDPSPTYMLHTAPDDAIYVAFNKDASFWKPPEKDHNSEVLTSGLEPLQIRYTNSTYTRLEKFKISDFTQEVYVHPGKGKYSSAGAEVPYFYKFKSETKPTEADFGALYNSPLKTEPMYIDYIWMAQQMLLIHVMAQVANSVVMTAMIGRWLQTSQINNKTMIGVWAAALGTLWLHPTEYQPKIYMYVMLVLQNARLCMTYNSMQSRHVLTTVALLAVAYAEMGLEGQESRSRDNVSKYWAKVVEGMFKGQKGVDFDPSLMGTGLQDIADAYLKNKPLGSAEVAKVTTTLNNWNQLQFRPFNIKAWLLSAKELLADDKTVNPIYYGPWQPLNNSTTEIYRQFNTNATGYMQAQLPTVKESPIKSLVTPMVYLLGAGAAMQLMVWARGTPPPGPRREIQELDLFSTFDRVNVLTSVVMVCLQSPHVELGDDFNALRRSVLPENNAQAVLTCLQAIAVVRTVFQFCQFQVDAGITTGIKALVIFLLQQVATFIPLLESYAPTLLKSLTSSRDNPGNASSDP